MIDIMEYSLILGFLIPVFLPSVSIKIFEKILPLFTNTVLLERLEEVSFLYWTNQTKALLY